MNAGAPAERVHETLKREIMDRAFRPGDRLDPAVLAGDLASSTTPVREALYQLAGEGLVESRTGTGFHLPALDEPALKDMYVWSAELLALALRGWKGGTPAAAPRVVSDAEDDTSSIAERTARLFTAIADRSLNGEHGRAIARLNVRLHAVRTIEPLLIDDGASELDAIEAVLHAGDKPDLRRCIATYHRRRIRSAAVILRTLYRRD